MEDAEDLITLSDNLNLTGSNNATVMGYAGKYFKLTQDINFSGKTFYGIGVKTQHAFMGNFDGQGYTIKI